jgi:hypothetical protein
LQALGVATVQEGIGALWKVNARLAHPPGQPMMLIQTDARRKGKVRAYADEHAAPGTIVQLKVVLVHPALLVLQKWTLVIFAAMFAIRMRAGSRALTMATT